MTQNHLLIKCLKGIEQRLSWIDSNQWQQKHFESLSELIYEKTKIRLSPLTLKRLWGKTKYESNPSATTLDTLAQFLDYKDWINFQNNQKGEIRKFKFNYLKNKKAVFFTSLILVAFVLIGFSMKFITRLKTRDYSNFEFSVQKLSPSIPNTVYFNYNVKNTDADSVIIQQSWDPRYHHLVDKNKTDFSCIYYYPGYYKAKLVLDNNVVAQEDLYITSNGWLGIIDKETVPIYLNAEDITDNNILLIKENQLIKAGFDLKNKIPKTTINLVEKFDSISGNDFELTASFKQTYPKGEAICQKAGLMITCSENYFYIPFSIKGCVNELKMNLPGKTLSAKDTDLRSLGVETTDTIHLKLNVSDGIFDLVVNNNSNIKDFFKVDPGKIVGIKFEFHGTGEIYDFTLKSSKTEYSMFDFMP